MPSASATFFEALLMGALLVSWLLASGCRQPVPAPGATTAGAAGKASPGLSWRGLEAVENHAGRPLWRVRAERATGGEAGARLRLEGVRAEFYGAGGVIAWGTAREAERRGETIRLMGGVRVQTQDASKGLEAEHASWSPAGDGWRAAGRLRFWQGPHSLVGQALRADGALMRVSLSGHVRGHFALDQVARPSRRCP